MSDYLRRAKRSATDLSVLLSLRLMPEDRRVAGPVPAFLRDISTYGAGLICDQVLVDDLHLFYAPEERDDLVLHLEDEDGADAIAPIPLRPVWFRLHEVDEHQYFHLGVEFQAEPDDARIAALFRKIRERLGGGKGFFGRLLLRFWPN